MDYFQLVDLFPYLTWDCPLNDSNYAAILARIIVSYIGKQEITLTMVNYQSEQRRLNTPYGSFDADTVMFRYKTCCLSTNGSFYLIEEKARKKWQRVVTKNTSRHGKRHRVAHKLSDWMHACDNKNLKYISNKDINDIHTSTPVINSKDYRLSFQKYLRTMENKQQTYIRPVDSGKQIKIEKICVIDLGDDDNYNSSDDEKDKKDEKDEKDEKDGKEVKLCNDFNWEFPLKQVSNTAMVFVMNNDRMTVFINDSNNYSDDPFYAEFNLEKSDKILDVWQCNKCIYSIIRSKLNNDTRLLLIKTYFVKTNKNGKKKNKRQEKKRNTRNTRNKEQEKGKKRIECDYEVKQKVLLNLIVDNSNSNGKNKNKNNKNKENSIRNNINTIPNVCKNCNYYDAKSQTLFIVENIKIESENEESEESQDGGIILCLISKEKSKLNISQSINDSDHEIATATATGTETAAATKTKTKTRKTNKRNTNGSKLEKLGLEESKTNAAISPKLTFSNSNSFLKNEKKFVTVIDEIKIQSIFLNLLLGQSKCHFVFFHKLSKTFILMLKIVDNVNEMELKEANSNMVNSGNYEITSINNLDRFLEWKLNLMHYNNGRLLVQLKIDFLNKKLISSRIGNININEDKCRIVAYDETRSMIIYDTLPNSEKQYKCLDTKKYKNKDNSDQKKKFQWNYHRVKRRIKIAAVEARIHDYKMMRLNDLVDRWIDLQIMS